jgi:DNA-binding response OmpR family regulator
MATSKRRLRSDEIPRNTKTVLVVDDDAGIRDLLTQALESEGLRVEVAANGMQALAKVRERLPDAVVLDITMPFMHGDDFLHTWRAKVRAPGVPVVAISAAYTAVRAKDLGVEEFFPKPFNLDALVQRVRELVARPPGSRGIEDREARSIEVRECLDELANQMSAIYGCVELISEDPNVTLLVRKTAANAVDASQRAAVLLRRVRHLVDVEQAPTRGV